MSGDKALEKAVAPYAGPKGNLQFPLDEPIPYDLIERVVKLRVKQDSEKAAASRNTLITHSRSSWSTVRSSRTSPVFRVAAGSNNKT